jgi:ATP-dependent DNA ligase
MLNEFVKPMLCESLDVEKITQLQQDRWLVERKYDGERSLFFIDFQKGYFRIQNRYLFDKTKTYPEFNLSALKPFISQNVLSCVLDGELIAQSNSFNDFQRRSHLSNSFKIKIMKDKIPLKFVVFDILMLNDKPTTAMPLIARKLLLTEILKQHTNLLELSHFTSKNIRKFFDEIVADNGEGIVMKYFNSPYEFARSHNWLKIKRKETETFKVLGWNERSGRGNYGSLKTTNGDVGLLSHVNKEEYDRLIKEVGLDKIWVEAEFQEKTKTGKMRFPIFKRLEVR